MDYNRIFIQDLGQRLARRLGMQTPNPAPTLAPEIMPVLSVEAPRQELSFLGGERIAWAHAVQVVSGGLYGRLILSNPVGSGMLAMVDYIDMVSTATGYFLLSPGAFTFSPLSPISADTRFNPGAGRNTALEWGTDVTGVPPIATRRFYVTQAGTRIVVQPELVLAPGWQLVWTAAAINASTEMNIRFRERPPGSRNELA